MQFIHCIALVIQHYAILFILQPYYKKHYKLLHNDYRDSNTLINKKLNHVSSCYPVKKKGYLSTFSDENLIYFLTLVSGCFDFLQRLLQVLNDFRILRVKIGGLTKVFLQVVQLHGGI